MIKTSQNFDKQTILLEQQKEYDKYMSIIHNEAILEGYNWVLSDQVSYIELKHVVDYFNCLSSHDHTQYRSDYVKNQICTIESNKILIGKQKQYFLGLDSETSDLLRLDVLNIFFKNFAQGIINAIHINMPLIFKWDKKLLT